MARRLAAGMVLVALTIGFFATRTRAAADALPSRLTDAQFWTLISDVSELNGSFRSDNLLSNEVRLQAVIPELTRVAKPDRVYLGVGPEQNFTYIAAVRPRMAFIVDVRRGNLDLHLMYKALFELSADRAAFVSRLFSRPRPDGLDSNSGAAEIFAAFAKIDSRESLYRSNLKAMLDQLTIEHGFALAAEDRAGIEYVSHAFFEFGPGVQYSSTGSFGGRYQPTYADLMTATDAGGQPRSYLATEDRFAFLRDLETRNVIVPVVGNFGGPRAIRRVGAYLKEKGAIVSAFYLSNVEQYLRQDSLWSTFCGNVAALPLDETSTFIRSVRGGRSGQPFGFGLNPELAAMAAEVKECGHQ